MTTGMTVTKDGTAALVENLKRLTKKQCMVGIPAENNERDEDAEFGNAAIGYVMENGSPAANIPARPHLVPGIKAASPRVAGILGAAARDVISGKGDVDKSLDAAGLVAVASVKNVIAAGIPPPLADSTLKSRKGKGAKEEIASRAAGNAPSMEFARPLIRTGEYMAHITHVIRESK